MNYSEKQGPERITYEINERSEIWNTGIIKNDKASSESMWGIKTVQESTQKKTHAHKPRLQAPNPKSLSKRKFHQRNV